MRTDFFRNTDFADAFAANPVRCIDIGARGGIAPDLLPIAFAVDAAGFEPAAEECARLAALPAAPWRSARFLPVAIAADDGAAVLRVTEADVSATLMEPDPEIGARFGATAFCTVLREVTVETLRLDTAIGRYALPPPDYIKIDVEGADLDCLAASPDSLSAAAAVRIEVSFLPLRKGQPVARDVDAFMAANGFELLDLIAPAHWRRHGDRTHPLVGREDIPYSRGQIVHGDYLYMRHPQAFAAPGSADRAIRAAAIALACGHFDRAEACLTAGGGAAALARDHGIDVAAALRQASLACGRAAWRNALWRNFRSSLSLLRQAGPLFQSARPGRAPPPRA